MVDDFPDLAPAIGKGLHMPAPGATVLVVDCSGGDVINEETGFERKAQALLEGIRQIPALRTLVFCNKIETCRKLENVLSRQFRATHSILPAHGAIRDDLRTRNLEEFLEPATVADDRKILVCTDRASRGLDSNYVEHVVLFDFPRDPSEYIRRVGRTARGAAGRGVVTALVLGRQVGLARELVQRNERGLPVHKVPDTEDFRLRARPTWLEEGDEEVEDADEDDEDEETEEFTVM